MRADDNLEQLNIIANISDEDYIGLAVFQKLKG